MDTPTNSSFIVQLSLTAEARWRGSSHSTLDIIGYEEQELINRSFFLHVHPNEESAVRSHLSRIVQADRSAVVLVLRLQHRTRGWVACALACTVVSDRIVGSVSLAGPARRAMFRGVTASEVIYVTRSPEVSGLDIGRWQEPNAPPAPPPTPVTTLSRRTFLLIDRFTEHSTILECSNGYFVSQRCTALSLFNFVHPHDMQDVNECVIALKHWGALEGGMLSDGGFAYIKFRMLYSGQAANTPPHTLGDVLVHALMWATSDGIIMIVKQAV